MMSEVFREELSRMHQKAAKKDRYSIGEAVRYLHDIGLDTTVSGLYTFLSRGKLNADKINGKLSFERSELDRFFLKKRKTNTKQAAATLLRNAAIAKDKRAKTS